MKVRITNLGAVKDAEIAVKPLTVFVGSNNTGKTWTAYTLAALFTPVSWEKYESSYIDGDCLEHYPILEKAISDFIEDGRTSIDLVQFFETSGLDYINGVAKLATSWIQEFIGSKLATLQDLDMRIELAELRSKIIDNITASKLELKQAVSKDGDALLNALKERGNSTLYFYTQKSGIPEDYPTRAIKLFISGAVFSGIHRAVYRNVFFFPAERTAFMPLVLCNINSAN